MIEIRSRRNQHTPIYHLPPEIYSRIFEFACSEIDFGHGPIMLVSKLWREIALGTPSLWTKINQSGAFCTATCILRSKNAPLEIAFLYPDLGEDGDMSATACTPHEEQFKEQVVLLMPHIHRWRCLTLENIRPGHFWPEFCMAAPQLETLDLSWNYDSDLQEAPPPGTPHDLFAGVTPRLRSLQLEQISIPLHSSIYRGLVELTLDDVNLHDATADEFLGVLQACPRLESLHLANVSMLGPTPGPQSTVDLPRLSSIYIHIESCRAIRHILSYIASPSLKSLSTSINLGNGEAIHDVLPSNTAADFTRTMGNIHIDRLNFRLSAFRGGTKFLNIVGGNKESPSALSIWGSSSSLHSLLGGLFSHLSSTFNLRALEAISVDGLPDSDVILTDFRQLLIRCYEVRRLEFKGCWSSIPISLRPVGAEDLPCPKLSELSISSSTPIDGWNLIEMVSIRRAVFECSQEGEDAAAIQMLHITHSHPLDEEVIQLLGTLVPQFSYTSLSELDV
ncbi:hypothetical protein BOTBODRAFT_254333 [Botryobasidium botryosum FD-172 SS1]|uniref:F-box domain-containing protein n=1 Tax=Botryobasidium botryosum (strain FD-172 SS1) TaxID=930990 RepID=A0A067M4A0_BOTB1|nr:hypothetical protein BOTBODRAFT_254333 [Botryobasidium botryosum FD-172 SS1]